MRRPKHIIELERAGVPMRRYWELQGELRELFGISAGYHPGKRAWLFSQVGGARRGECIVATVWLYSASAFAELLLNPQRLAAQFRAKLPPAALVPAGP